MGEKNLLIIDGFNLLSRAYFATAYNKTEDQLTRNRSGQYINALRVFFQKLYNLINEHHVNHVAIAWDIKREETERRQKYDFYKASRNELPMPLIQQYETLTMILEQLGIVQLTIPPHEADDVIGSLAKKWSEKPLGHCYIYSNDKDLLQLLNEHTTQIIAQKRNEMLYTVNHFKADYQIETHQWIDVKALLGDTSDNIPGVAGIGQKSALPLIQHYQSIENLYQTLPNIDAKFNRCRKKLIAGELSAKISKDLATINCDIGLFVDFELEQLYYSPKSNYVNDVLAELDIRIRMS
ncbi:5'-3' exonuclease [Amphibacillus sediminis]|uniref:5'-3' exonuclease n=1 Tax=Amphibacillus sediminis TaxID=360185 RepID=UPI000836E796|nr:5'-3' exonuclease [Amphibacillus sediminis]